MLITKFPVKTCQKLEGINKCNIWFINERSNIAQKNLVQCFPDISWLLKMNECKDKKKKNRRKIHLWTRWGNQQCMVNVLKKLCKREILDEMKITFWMFWSSKKFHDEKWNLFIKVDFRYKCFSYSCHLHDKWILLSSF